MDEQLKTTLLKLCQAIEQLSGSVPGGARHLVADARRIIAASSAAPLPWVALACAPERARRRSSRKLRAAGAAKSARRRAVGRSSARPKLERPKSRAKRREAPRKSALKRR